MKFNSFSFSAAVVTAVVAGSALTTSPAQAFDIYSRTLTFNGNAKLSNKDVAVGGFSTFDFVSSHRIGLGTDSVFGALDQSLNFKDLKLTKTTATTWSLFGEAGAAVTGPVTNFITGMSNGITYSLTGFELSFEDNSYVADLVGFFDPGAIAASGPLTSQIRLGTTGTTYSGEITAVPTPALLPGLLGLGVAALRKRKTDAREKVSAEV